MNGKQKRVFRAEMRKLERKRKRRMVVAYNEGRERGRAIVVGQGRAIVVGRELRWNLMEVPAALGECERKTHQVGLRDAKAAAEDFDRAIARRSES